MNFNQEMRSRGYKLVQMAHVFFASMLLQAQRWVSYFCEKWPLQWHWGELEWGVVTHIIPLEEKPESTDLKFKARFDTRKVPTCHQNKMFLKGEASVAGGESWTQFHSNIKYNLSFVDSILTTENNLDLGLFLAFNIL